MSTARPSPSPTAVDDTPLLPPTSDQLSLSRRFGRRTTPSLRGAARFLRRASSRRVMREPSMRVRETAAEQIEVRQSDWAYSRPIVVLDLIWNFAFVVVVIAVLIVSRTESPETPLRLWVVGYAFQCVLHMVCVWVEYKRRLTHRGSSESLRSGPSGGGGGGNSNSNSNSSLSLGSDGAETGGHGSEQRPNEQTSVAKHLESANTMFSFIWWIIGFYWVSANGETLARDSPQLYWLCIVFLAFDVFFVVICVAVACLIGIAVCCCLPCIIALLYAVADQEGATKEDIEQLTKYKFRRIGDYEKQNGEIQESFGGIMTECDTDTPIEHALSQEDAECCICLSAYDDGTELRELPCRHHFHCTCIDKWLYINATCPLCKFNILKNGSLSSSEDA